MTFMYKMSSKMRVQAANLGIKVIVSSVSHLSTSTSFPSDLLHDLLEGIILVELALCIREMIRLKYFSLEYLNQRITSFPYQHTDKVNKPHPVPKTFMTREQLEGTGVKMPRCSDYFRYL